MGGRRWGNPLECTRDLGGGRLSRLKGGTLDEMPYSGEKKLVEFISSRKTGQQVRDEFATPQSETLTCLKELPDKNREKPEEKALGQ